MEFNEHLDFYHILPFPKHEFQAFSTGLEQKGKKKRIEKRTLPTRQELDNVSRNLGSVIYTHSNWKIEVILRISGPQIIFNRKKKIIEENHCVCVCVHD